MRWCLLPHYATALKFVVRNLGDLFEKVDSIGILIHTTSLAHDLTGQALSRLLSNGEYPFYEIYTNICPSLMTRERIEEIETYNYQNILLPSNCLLNLDGSLINDEMDLFAELPLHYDDTIPKMTTTRFMTNIGRYSKNRLLQNCNWVYHKRVSSLIARASPSVLVGGQDPAGWAAFHHSCYVPDRSIHQDDKRMFSVINGLVEDLPLHSFLVPSLRLDEYYELTRWCLHLLLILFQFTQYKEKKLYFDCSIVNSTMSLMNMMKSDPIKSYLVLLQGRLNTSPKEEAGLLREMIQAGINYHQNIRTSRIRKNILPVEPPPLVPTMTMVLGGLSPFGNERGRWSLDCFQYYETISPGYNNYIMEELQKVLEFYLERATPMEQYSWCTLFFQGKIRFAEQAFIKILRKDLRLQKRILLEVVEYQVRLRSSWIFQFIQEVIPLKTRLWYIRYRFMWRQKCHRNLKRLKDKFMRNANISSSNIHSIVSSFVLDHTDASSGKFALLAHGRLRTLSFVLCLSIIYKVNLPTNLSSDQIKLVLGFEVEPTEQTLDQYFEVIEQPSDQLANIIQRIDDAIDMAEDTIPPILTWSETSQLLYK